MSFFEGIDFYVVLFVILIVAVILKSFNRNLKAYIFALNIFFILVIYGQNLRSLLVLIGFVCWQYMLVLLSLKYQKNSNLLRGLIFLGVLPLMVNKIESLASLNIIAFLGISYLSFKSIQILIEIYDGIIDNINLYDFLQFILFFPSISSGPIDRSRRFLEEMNTSQTKENYYELVGTGLYRLCLGMLYKVVLAKILYDVLQGLVNENTIIYAVKYMYLYTFYLFFDFAGYSLMAVGTSNILGISTPMNFNKPFLSIDIKDFWNRWHITLSIWLRDFVFTRVYMNLIKKRIFKKRLTSAMTAYLTNMVVMGLWHGITPSYILYGLYHGVLMSMYEYYQKKSKFYKQHRNKNWYKVTSWLINFNLIAFGMLLFSGEFIALCIAIIKNRLL